MPAMIALPSAAVNSPGCHLLEDGGDLPRRPGRARHLLVPELDRSIATNLEDPIQRQLQALRVAGFRAFDRDLTELLVRAVDSRLMPRPLRSACRIAAPTLFKRHRHCSALLFSNDVEICL
jgi:hypothetical protein